MLPLTKNPLFRYQLKLDRKGAFSLSVGFHTSLGLVAGIIMGLLLSNVGVQFTVGEVASFTFPVMILAFTVIEWLRLVKFRESLFLKEVIMTNLTSAELLCAIYTAPLMTWFAVFIPFVAVYPLFSEAFVELNALVYWSHLVGCGALLACTQLFMVIYLVKSLPKMIVYTLLGTQVFWAWSYAKLLETGPPAALIFLGFLLLFVTAGYFHGLCQSNEEFRLSVLSDFEKV